MASFSEQQAIQRQLEDSVASQGNSELLAIAEASFNAARRLGGAPGFDLLIEECTRAQALYLGKGALWRSVRRVKLGHRALTGGSYLEP
ncbi:TPA: hypothetical protein EYN23_08385 [Candidatus Poribacteria bacterium]|nr:hypothetical protein [Candidatus Poribacteria bacterium]